MVLKDRVIGFGFTGAYCVFEQVFPELERLAAEGAAVVPLVSYQAAVTDTRYGKAAGFLERMERIAGRPPVMTITEAETVNKQGRPLDLLVIAPCTASTLSKLASGVSDTPVLMMAKEQFRNDRPVVLGIATNEGLGLSARNIGVLLSAKNVFFVPFGQDDPEHKPNSLIAKFESVLPTVLAALQGRQYQPVLEKY